MALTAKKVYAILKRQISDMEAKLNSPVRYRGTVATADLLPLNPDIGDMYNIESKSIYGEAGMNVAWNGVVWDTMGAPIDMSLYLTKEEAERVIQRLVTEYFEKNPVKPGATTEQAQQIEQNKTDIASLKTETGSLKEDISNKITKFYASSQGESHLADSDNGKIVDMMLYGKSEQKQYSGKNLFDFHQLKPKDPSITTVTTTEDAIIVSSNAQIYTGAFKIYEEYDAFKGKTITISANIVKVDNFDALVKFGCGLFYENKWHWKLQKVTDLGTRYITVIVPETITKIQFLLTTNDNNVAKANTITVSEYMVEYGSEPTTYEPYTGGIPSPNPDYPQEIKSVVNPTVKVCGKNLVGSWKQDMIDTDNGILIIPNDFWIHSEEYIKVNTENYTFSSDSICKATIYEYDNDKKYISFIQPLKESKNAIYTPSSKCVYIRIGYNYDGANEAITPSDMGVSHWIQFELGSTPTTYEPYHEQTVTLPYTLNAIPVNSGGNVTINGQQYIADYVDVERGKLVRNVLVKTFTGNEGWAYSDATDDSKKRFYLEINKKIKSAIGISNYLRSIGADIREGDNCFAAYTRSLDVRITSIASLAEFKSFLARLDSNGKPLNVLFALGTPEEIDLTQEEISAFKALSTNYPVTNIEVSSDQLDGYTVFNYPISMANGWNYVKQQIGDTRDYIYDMDARTQDTDLQAAEAYVNSEYAVTLTELEV